MSTQAMRQKNECSIIEEAITFHQLLDADQLTVARLESKRQGIPLQRFLIEQGWLTASALTSAVARQSRIPAVSLREKFLNPSLVDPFPEQLARYHMIVPFAEEGNALHVALSDPTNILAIDALRKYYDNREIVLFLAPEADIKNTIDQCYGQKMAMEEAANHLDQWETSTTFEGEDHPIIGLIDQMIDDAIDARASDIHFEPEDFSIRIRCRIDGLLHTTRLIHKNHWSRLNVRLKVMSGMDIAETRLPQNGRFTKRMGAKEYDFRVASHPTSNGENIVIRILDKTAGLMPLSHIGFEQPTLDAINRALKQKQGMIIATGPTGSGKTTTLYSMLSQMNDPSINIMTLEDPIEYQLPFVRQTQVREHAGFTFADGVRSILRQDPDIIFIGEIRDEQTAAMALRASMTGHQVFTTLHTNDSFGAIPRLMDLGVSSGMLAYNILAIIAQRLVRTLCPRCKIPAENPPTYEAKGCSHCRGTGYYGRTAIAELLIPSPAFHALLSEGATFAALRGCAEKDGLVYLCNSAMEKVKKGETSLREIESIGMMEAVR